MDTPSKQLLRPRSDADWEPFKAIFTKLYMEDGRPLREVMQKLKDDYSFSPSEKQCKNKIKLWRLSKYLKEEEAKRIAEGDTSAIPSAFSKIAPEEAREKANRALKRKRGREKNQQPRNATPDLDRSESSEVSADSPSPPPPTVPALVTYSSNMSTTPYTPITDAPTPQMDALQVMSPEVRFIVNLRKWTNEACIYGHWESLPSEDHQNAREASRTFAANLTAGIDLYKEGKEDLAWPYWNRAFTSFKEELLRTWYYETPMRLLFETARLVQSDHKDLAQLLLNSIANWADRTFSDQSDCRYALFSNFGKIDVTKLLDLYKRAAKCLIDGIQARMDPDHPLQYEVRLNRALDIMWFEPLADLSEWLPMAEVVDSKLGPTNPYSIYYLLLEAYRYAARDEFDLMNGVCSQIGLRLRNPDAEQKIDPWRVGLAYRRLGRQLHNKGKLGCLDPRQRYLEARRNFNQALKYVNTDTKLKASVLIGICHCQLDLAKAVDDEEDVFLWNEMLSQLERQDQQDMLLWKAQVMELEQKLLREQEEIEFYYTPQLLLPDTDSSHQSIKRRRVDEKLDVLPH